MIASVFLFLFHLIGDLPLDVALQVGIPPLREAWPYHRSGGHRSLRRRFSRLRGRALRAGARLLMAI